MSDLDGLLGRASKLMTLTYYSRTQEASADQAAISIMCAAGIDGKYLINFLSTLEKMEDVKFSTKQNYRSTHPFTENRITWIDSALDNYENCNFVDDETLSKRFKMLRAKLHGFTHSYEETEAVYNSGNNTDLYANAVSSYFRGNHKKSIDNLKKLIVNEPTNPFYKELIGEIYYANKEYKKAIKYQKEAISENNEDNDLYLMMMGNYLLSLDDPEATYESINFLKKSIHINPKNAYSWYLVARAYSQIDNLALANYATAERYFLIGERTLSYDFATKAIKNIEEFSPEWYRSLDLIEILEKEVSTNRQ